ncbi:hypothetical protein ACE01N_10540 [Saccharicrinis sp. FJH2]|uniref:hypothetical protein n=1 Tax=Saccharicrinis sp. FJH65 TaxID=3344659 RepID=UPI0035F3528F
MDRLNRIWNTGEQIKLSSDTGNKILVEKLEEEVREACTVRDNIGMEVLNFSGVSSLAIESLITSCTSFDQSLAVVNNSSRGTFVKQIAAINKVHFKELYSANSQIPELKELERFLAANKSLRYLILPLISIEGLEKKLLQLSDLLSEYNIGLLVDYYGRLEGLKIKLLKYNILCISITPSDYKFGLVSSSVLVAQRRFLVSCEGNAKTYSLDLYAAWQKKLWNNDMVV